MSNKIAEGYWKVLYSKSDRFYRVKKVGWNTFQADYVFLFRSGTSLSGTFYAGPNFRWGKKGLQAGPAKEITKKEYFLAVLRGGTNDNG